MGLLHQWLFLPFYVSRSKCGRDEIFPLSPVHNASVQSLKKLLSIPAYLSIFNFSISDSSDGKEYEEQGRRELMTKLYRKCGFDVREEDIIILACVRALSRARVTMMKTIGEWFRAATIISWLRKMSRWTDAVARVRKIACVCGGRDSGRLWFRTVINDGPIYVRDVHNERTMRVVKVSYCLHLSRLRSIRLRHFDSYRA